MRMRLTRLQIKPSLFLWLLPLLLILLLAWLLRLYALDADSLWGDEIFSYQRGIEPNREVSYKMLLDGNHPPLYELLILHEWLKVGRNEFFLRFPSVFFALLTISVVYLLAQAAFDRTTGLLSALLLAISPLHVYYSREARMYGLLACLLTLALYFLYRAIKPTLQSSHKRPIPPSPYALIAPWAGFSLFIAYSLYTHYYTFFTLLAIQGFILTRLLIKFDSGLLKGWIGSNLALILFFSPWLPTLFIQLNNEPVEWIQPISFIELLQLPVYFFVRRELVPEWLWWLVSFAMWIALLVAFARMMIPSRRYSKQLMSYLYLTSCFVGTLLIAYLISFFKPLIVTRYFMGIVPLTCILLAFALRQVRFIALPLMALMVTTALFSSVKITTSLWQEDWRGVTDYIEQHSQADDRIMLFFPVGLEFWVKPFEHYYDGQLPTNYVRSELSDKIESQKMLDRLKPHHHQRLWVIQSARNTLSEPLPDVLTSPFADYRLIDRQTFGRALVPKEYTIDLLLLEVVTE